MPERPGAKAALEPGGAVISFLTAPPVALSLEWQQQVRDQVRALRDAGFSAQLVDLSSEVISPLPSDLLVVPELFGDLLRTMCPGIPRLALNRDVRLTWSNVADTATHPYLTTPDLRAVLSTSSYDDAVLSSVFPDLAVPVLRYPRGYTDGSDVVGAPVLSPSSRTQRLAIAPGSDEERVRVVLAALDAAGTLTGWEVVVLDGRSELDTVLELDAAAILLSFAETTRPTSAERDAMAGGALVVGISGRGWLDERIGFSAPRRDLAACTKLVADLVDALERDPCAYDDRRRAAARLASAERRREDHDALVALFDGLAPEQRRHQPVRCEPIRPAASVVILAWNAWERTKACLDSVLPTLRPDDEVIVVDNGSRDDTPRGLLDYPGITVATNEENHGFARGCNEGAALARNEIVVFLNNDTIVTRGWIDELLEPFDEPLVGATGPRSNGVSGLQLLFPVPYETAPSPELDEFAAVWSQRAAGERRTVERLVGFCLAVRASAFDEVNGFDEGYGTGGFEDDDLCRRLRGLGWKLLIVDSAFVHHEMHATFAANGLDWYGEQERNRARFEGRDSGEATDSVARLARARELAAAGRASEAADAYLLLLATRGQLAIVLPELVDALRQSGRPLGELVAAVGEGEERELLGKAISLSPAVADGILEAALEAGLETNAVLGAAALLAPRLALDRTLAWSARIRAAGFADSCPLLAVARGTSHPIERARAAAVAFAAFADPRAATALAVALVAAPTWRRPAVRATAEALAPGLADRLSTAKAPAPPRATVVIPCFDHVELTRRCLEALERGTDPDLYEVVIVDNGSSDDTKGLGALVDGRFRYLRNAENVGFGPACNAGAAMSASEFVVFLNNDTEPQAGWLERLLETMDDDPTIAAAQPKLLFPDGRVGDAGGAVFRGGAPYVYGKWWSNVTGPSLSYRRDVDYASGACLIVRRSCFEQVGGFDARYAPAYFEDVDLSFALRERGWRTVYEPSAVVVHLEGGTAGTDTSTGLKSHQVRNAAVFAAKWESELAARPLLTPAEVENWVHRPTSPEGRRALVVSPWAPAFDRTAGGLRLAVLLQQMRQAGHAVTLCSTEAASPEYRSWLAVKGIEYFDGVDLLTLHTLASCRTFDTVMVVTWPLAAKIAAEVRRLFPAATFVIDTVDVHHVRLARQAVLFGDAELARSAATSRRGELGTCALADRVVVASEIEASLFEEADVVVVPTAHPDFGCGPDFEGREGIVFVGNFNHPPNVDAVTWWDDEIAPRLARTLPGVPLTIVGNDPWHFGDGLRSDALRVLGTVPSVVPYLHSARVSVAPLRFGAGMKGKVGEALSAGTPLVATTVACEGMAIVDRHHALVADDPDAFAAAVTELYTDRELWRQIREQGRSHAAARLGVDQIAAAVPALMAPATRRPAPRQNVAPVSPPAAAEPVRRPPVSLTAV